MKGIWITWEFQRRNSGISAAIEFPLYQIDIQSCRTIRYLKSILATYKVIKSENPSIVVAQNPSILLAFLVIIYSKYANYHPVIDAHNSGIYPLEGRLEIINKLARWLQRQASLTIVTNQALKNVVEKNRGQALVLPDAIPTPPEKLTDLQLKGKKNLACICTFNEDEPYREILKAASLLPKDIYVYFTGKFEGKINTKNLPNNVQLTGFIPEAEYWNLLYSSDIIIDLTLREDCLVCGAYEGIALNKPLILSNTITQKKYFSQGCVYANPIESDIVRAMKEAIQNRENLRKGIISLRSEIDIEWGKKISNLKANLNGI